MPLLLDAFNILHVTGVLPPEMAGIDVEGLADLIERSRFAREEVWLVCDGRRPPGPSRRRERIALSYSGAGHSADDWIKGLVERTSSPRTMTVVTNDRAIERAVKRRGASTMSSEAFLQALVDDHVARRRSRPKPQKPEALTPRETKKWLAIFGLDETVLTIAPTPAPKAERPSPKSPSTKAPPPALADASARAAAGNDLDDPLDQIDFARLLAEISIVTPPPRSGVRAPRRSRRDTRR
jgi:predicted RNA-binding protein with PIN domain